MNESPAQPLTTTSFWGEGDGVGGGDWDGMGKAEVVEKVLTLLTLGEFSERRTLGLHKRSRYSAITTLLLLPPSPSALQVVSILKRSDRSALYFKIARCLRTHGAREILYVREILTQASEGARRGGGNVEPLKSICCHSSEEGVVL